MILTGIGDEAGEEFEQQIAATRDLGWSSIEARTVQVEGFDKANLHDVPDAAFDLAVRRLEDAGIGVYCFGSTIMNWARRVEDPFAITEAEVKRAIARMLRLKTKFVRIMSFKPGEEEYRIPRIVFQRVKDITNRFVDAGLQPLHENCMNYGGMSWQHALELLDKCPGLQWLFDTSNPLANPDRSQPKPWPRQDPWVFWENVRDHARHIHIKDAVWDEEKKSLNYVWPGEGHARVAEVVKDALARSYAGALSIEPHMVSVFHETVDKPARPDSKRANFVQYGKLLEEIVKESKD